MVNDGGMCGINTCVEQSDTRPIGYLECLLLLRKFSLSC